MVKKLTPFVWVSFAMAVGVMSTALISPLYPLYQAAWSLQASDISLIYVIYMGGALASLLFLGRLPDRIGFHKVMLWALGLSLGGTVLSAVAWNMPSLIVGRFVVGVSSSMMTTSASMGLGLLSKAGSAQRVAMVTGFLIAFGFGLGPLVGGVMGQWAPHPLVTAYLPTLVLGLCGWWVLKRLQLPAHARPGDEQAPLQGSDFWPRLTWSSPADSWALVLTCGFPFLAFGVFGMYASMAPLFLESMLSFQGPLVSGLAIALILLVSAGVQIATGYMATARCGGWGMAALVLSNALLLANIWAASAWVFLAGVLFTAIGHGMSMLAGMSMVSRLASPANRSGLLATYLVIGYIGSMLPMMGMGWVADHWGIEMALGLFCAMVIVVGSVLAVAFARHPRMQ